MTAGWGRDDLSDVERVRVEQVVSELAAESLDELAGEMLAVSREIREGTTDAYARVYHLRRRLGYVVNTLADWTDTRR